MKKYAVTKSFSFDGKRYYVRADSEVEAEVKKALKIRDLEEGKIVLSGDMTVREWAKRCTETYKTSLREVSLKAYNQRMKTCILDHIGDMKLKSVKALDCQECLNQQSEHSQWLIKQTRQTLNFLFKKAVENQLILTNPAANLTEPQGYKNTRRALTAQEEDIFLKVAYNDFKRFSVFLLMYHCGCRPSEARNALGLDLNIIDGYPLLHIRGTKTKASDREVPIPDELYNMIKNTPKDKYIAPDMYGKYLSDKSYVRAWSTLKREMNIAMGCKVYRNELIPPLPLAPDLVPYCLRHTFCTNLQKQGVDIRTAQYLMGHADIQMTANIYTHTDRSTVLEAAKQIGCNSGCNSERVSKGIK